MEKKKILLAEDSDIQRNLIKEILSDLYEVVEAVDGQEALEFLKARHNEFSLVLLDIEMPRMDGISVLKAMDENGWIDKLPVIVLSADSSRETVGSAYIYGVECYISKPYNADDVLAKVASAIRK